MKKILYVHGNSNIIGGIETFIENCLFHHKKFEPFIIFINDGRLPQRIKEKGFKNILVLNGGRLRHIHKTIKCIFSIVSYVKRHNINIIIGNGHHAWIYAGLSAKLAGVKGIFYNHGILCESNIKLPNLIEFVASKIKPSIIFANSVASKESIEKYTPGIKTELLYPCIDINKFNGCVDVLKIREELKIKDEKVITMIGRIQEWKGQEYFVKAVPLVLKEFRDTYFLIVGNSTFEKDNDYFDRIKRIINDFEVKKNVIITGFREDIPQIVALSDILVHASITPEPFGLVVVEGMAAGKPVIATNLGGPTEIIKDGQDGLLVPPKNENALAKAMIRLLKNDELRKRIGKKAKETVTESFSIDKCIMRMEDIIEKNF